MKRYLYASRSCRLWMILTVTWMCIHIDTYIDTHMHMETYIQVPATDDLHSHLDVHTHQKRSFYIHTYSYGNIHTYTQEVQAVDRFHSRLAVCTHQHVHSTYIHIWKHTYIHAGCAGHGWSSQSCGCKRTLIPKYCGQFCRSEHWICTRIYVCMCVNIYLCVCVCVIFTVTWLQKDLDPEVFLDNSTGQNMYMYIWPWMFVCIIFKVIWLEKKFGIHA
jgi:hypothetical protein